MVGQNMNWFMRYAYSGVKPYSVIVEWARLFIKNCLNKTFMNEFTLVAALLDRWLRGLFRSDSIPYFNFHFCSFLVFLITILYTALWDCLYEGAEWIPVQQFNELEMQLSAACEIAWLVKQN